MIYQSAKMSLNCIRDVLHGEVNDVYICEDVKSGLENYYTLWVVHDTEIARQILDFSDFYIEAFAHDDDLCVVLDYVEERNIGKFYTKRAVSYNECETVCMNLVLKCVSTKIPYPILLLILKQLQINFSKDKKITFSYLLDLEKIDFAIGEQECALQCAKILLELLDSKKKQNMFSYSLLELKISKRGYNSFMELYTDIRLSATSKQNENLFDRIRNWFEAKKDIIFKVLLIAGIVFGIVALVVFVSSILWGDVLIYRFFINNFKQIGTINLVK